MKRKVLFISSELISGDLSYRIKMEGFEVKLFIEDKGMKKCLDGLVNKTNNWKSELTWVGKDGLIIFDDVGYGKEQEKLRNRGYLVVGAGIKGELLELDRIHAQEVLKKAGVFKSDFDTMKFTLSSAIKFIEKNKGKWVVKQNDHNTALNYVGNMDDSSDVLGVLEKYKNIYGGKCSISLQKKVDGVEVALGRFFNGNKWIGPMAINFEHKHLCNDDIGPLGGETGTLMWFDDNEKNNLFQKTLAKIESHLKKIKYKGYIDINCIINGDKVFPLELTSRFGSSTIETQCEIQTSSWGDFFFAIAKGEDINVEFKKGYCLNVALTVSPFPYRTNDKNLISDNFDIHFDKSMTEEEFSHVRFEGVYLKKINKINHYFTAGNLGYVLYVTEMGKDVQEARERVYSIIKKITIPKMFYRTDIGTRFIRKDQALLKKWGWI